MSEPKTKPTRKSVDTYLNENAPAGERRSDCATLMQIMQEATGEPPVMWGESIVGFGAYHYTYDSGHKGTSCRTGFASRTREISVYLVAAGPDQAALLKKLGKHRMGKACLYIRRLSEIDLDVLKQLIASSLSEVRRRHG